MLRHVARLHTYTSIAAYWCSHSLSGLQLSPLSEDELSSLLELSDDDEDDGKAAKAGKADAASTRSSGGGQA
jgi:hypothetical protein